MGFKYIDFDKEVSKDELLDIIKNNWSVSLQIRNEIGNYNKEITSNEPKHQIKSEKQEKAKKTAKNEEANAEFEDEVNFYLTMLSALKDEEFTKENIISFLPSKNNIRYEDIIIRICAEYLKEIKDYKELITEEEASITKKELIEYKEEINNIKNKIDVINNVMKEKDTNQEEIKNKLFFAKTNGKNIRVIEDINNIVTEYYDEFKSLFDSIINGDFKRVKRFLHNNNFVGLCEVRGFCTRVIFDRIGNNDYVILGAFIKKTDTNKAHTIKLDSIAKNYQNQKDYLKSQLTDPDFIIENQEYCDELYKILNNHTKVKTK